jgi:uncharacterized protein Veg
MLLKKLENNGEIKATYSSSNIVSSIYNKATKALTIIFTNGGQYKYSDVSLTDYTRFELADSQGAVHNSHIKKHTFETLAKVDTKALLVEISDLKTAEKKQLLEDSAIVMTHKLQGILTYYQVQGTIEPDLFKKGLDAMLDYKTKSEAK